MLIPGTVFMKSGSINNGGESMKILKRFLTATDVAELLDVSRSTAYRIIKRLNDELNKAGKITMAGKVSAKYFYENTYL